MSVVYESVNFCFGKKILIVEIFICVWMRGIGENCKFYISLSENLVLEL